MLVVIYVNVIARFTCLYIFMDEDVLKPKSPMLDVAGRTMMLLCSYTRASGDGDLSSWGVTGNH